MVGSWGEELEEPWRWLKDWKREGGGRFVDTAARLMGSRAHVKYVRIGYIGNDDSEW